MFVISSLQQNSHIDSDKDSYMLANMNVKMQVSKDLQLLITP